MELPRIDLQNVDLTALDEACRHFGFFALQGHGLHRQEYRAALDMAATFFAQTNQAKNQIRRSASNMWGYYDAELTKNRRDWKEILDIGEAAAPGAADTSMPQWPDVPGFRPCIESTRKQLHETALEVVALIGRALGAKEDLHAAFAEHTSFLRLNYYPTCEQPAPPDAGFVPEHGELGISHHTDAGAVTVLMLDDQPGLQFYHDGQWHVVNPVQDALIINIGDVVQVWSNDRYTAPLHRVLVDSTRTRISIPYFLNPGYACNYEPLKSLDAADNPPQYRPINWGEFRHKRSQGDFSDYGQEVQISDYRLTDHPAHQNR